MQYYNILFIVLVVSFHITQASAPVQKPQVKTKIGTLVSPTRIYNHRRISSVALGAAFTGTVKEILKSNNKIQSQFKSKAEKDFLAPLRAYPDDIINSSDEHGNTALHLAAFEGGAVGEAMVKHLLNKDAIHINKKNSNSYTPLIESIRNSQYEIFMLLVVREEAIIALADQYGRTAVDYINDLSKDDINKEVMLKAFKEVCAKKLARKSTAPTTKKYLDADAQAKKDSQEEANLIGSPSDSCMGCLGNLFCNS